jgi:N-acetylmuramoyl-L-alanine amidase
MRISRLLTSLFLLASLGSPAGAAVIQGLRTEQAEDHTRLIFELDAPLQHSIFTLEDPNRVVIDLEGTQLKAKLDSLDLSQTPISRIRSAARNDKDLRVVFDLRQPVQPRSFLVARDGKQSERLVIELRGAAVPQTAATSTQEPVAAAIATAAETNNRDIVIAISAGHGGQDPGAIGVNRLQEKRVTLAIAREVETLINATPGFRAVMLRDGDYYVGLWDRVQLAHKHNADFYLAIHADAHRNANASGATIYALSQHGATSEQARLLAEKENSADLIGGSGSVSLRDREPVLASVLLDLSMSGTIATSLEIGDRLISTLGKVSTMRRKNVEQAAFVELKSADIPSLLVESGYITNARDARNLDNPQWRQSFAAALVQGITQWFLERPPRGTWVAWQQTHGGSTGASTYTVKRGDTLSQIADRFHVSMALLKATNNLKGDGIQVGQTLKLPVAGTTPAPAAVASYVEHKISRGETLSQIASNYSVPMERLRQVNALKSDTIRVGQILKIPTT